jgi:hypothetical protein
VQGSQSLLEGGNFLLQHLNKKMPQKQRVIAKRLTDFFGLRSFGKLMVRIVR